MNFRTVTINVEQLREQKNHLLTLPASEQAEGLAKLVDSILNVSNHNLPGTRAAFSPAQRKATIDLLWGSLHKDHQFTDRRHTGWGTATQEGLVKRIERISFYPESLPR